MHPAGGRVPAGSREPAEETAEGGEPVTAKPAANSFQHHGEQLALGTAPPGQPLWEKLGYAHISL